MLAAQWMDFKEEREGVGSGLSAELISFQAYTGLAARLDWMDYEPLLALIAANTPFRANAYAQFVETGIEEEEDGRARP